MGTHGNCYGGKSNILPVRELAMMMIMDKLTDKKDWHIKVFDDEIIASWRKEAFEFPDDSLWKLAISGKMDDIWIGQNEDADHFDWPTMNIKPLQGIISNEAFDYVSVVDKKPG